MRSRLTSSLLTYLDYQLYFYIDSKPFLSAFIEVLLSHLEVATMHLRGVLTCQYLFLQFSTLCYWSILFHREKCKQTLCHVYPAFVFWFVVDSMRIELILRETMSSTQFGWYSYQLYLKLPIHILFKHFPIICKNITIRSGIYIYAAVFVMILICGNTPSEPHRRTIRFCSLQLALLMTFPCFSNPKAFEKSILSTPQYFLVPSQESNTAYLFTSLHFTAAIVVDTIRSAELRSADVADIHLKPAYYSLLAPFSAEIFNLSKLYIFVGIVGLEPTRTNPPNSKSDASTNFAISRYELLTGALTCWLFGFPLPHLLLRNLT